MKRSVNPCAFLHRLGALHTAGISAALIAILLGHQVFAANSLREINESDLIAQNGGKTGFTQLPPSLTGITFTNHLSDTLAESNRILENGSGVALGDVDGDGWCDIYLCRLEGSNVLYRNLGHWKFENITPASGVACPDQFSTGAVFADLDGDGDLDLLVNSIGGGTRSFRNDGQGSFSEDLESGLIRKFGSTSMALADIDGDGDLDLYVANYRTTNIRDGISEDEIHFENVNGKIVVQPEERFAIVMKGNDNFNLVEKGEADFLYLNDGKGRFKPVSWTNGAFSDPAGKPMTAPPRHWGLAAMFRDFTGDNVPDLYVCNDFIDSPDDVWLNQGKGQFRAISNLALRKTSWSSMAVDFADINRDGLVDFFVVDMLSRDHQRRQTQRANADMASLRIRIGEIENRPQAMRNTLFLNRGDGTFAELAQLAGLQASEWSWSVCFLDVDLDGFEDLLITNGNGHDVLDADTATRVMPLLQGPPQNRPKTLLLHPRLETANLAFRNQGDLTFEEAGKEWGFNAFGISHGMALGDLDNDGDLDVVINNFNSVAAVCRNNSAAPRIAVRLKGQAPNTRGIGGKIRISGGLVEQSQEIICGGRYLSADDSMRVFAAGSSTNKLTIEVSWRSGKCSLIEAATANGIYEIDEAAAAPARSPMSNVQESKVPGVEMSTNVSSSRITQHASRSTPFFEDVSHLLNHTHHELPFDDFGRQPLLPNRLGQMGPGIAWQDLDGDGWDDLVIGSGRSGQLALFRNDGRGSFNPLPLGKDVAASLGDQGAIVGWNSTEGRASIWVAISNYEGGGTSEASLARYEIKSGRVEEVETLPGQTASVGPLAMADIDGDGDLDLFAGGRLNPGRYPQPATSRLYRNDSGRFRLDREKSLPFVECGLVSGAIFSDLNGDGPPELLLACEWDTIRVFANQGGTFTETTARLGLSSFRGRWNGVTTGDFDGDGRMDIVASNWGRNTKYQRHLTKPLQIYYGDFDQSGTVDIVESYFDKSMNKAVPWRGLVSMRSAMPFIHEAIPTFQAYGGWSVEEILGDKFEGAHSLSVDTLDSMLWLNRGGHFEPRPLPIEAQFAPAFAILAGDYDGDGKEDLFMSQNFFGVHPETSRYDGGHGVWLKGNGDGTFKAVSGQESGIRVYGEQRGSALADYDGDGRVDLVVTQNGAATKLYRNVRATPGLRVRVRGGPDNPTGVGATVRPRYGEQLGPAREIHAGSGYWSQDSAVMVLGGEQRPTAIEVHWPDHKSFVAEIPPVAREVTIDRSGSVSVRK